MKENKLITYLIFAIIILSAVFHYAAYALAAVVFFVMLRKDGKQLIDILYRQKAIIFIFAALGASTLFSKVLLYSILIDMVILLLLMTFLIIVRYVNEENILAIFRLLNFLGILICVFGLYQYVTGDMNVNKSWTDQSTFGYLNRIYSTFRNPNIFAAYLTFNICYAAAYFFNKKADAFTVVNIAISSICLILTYSRGGFIAFTVSMVLIAIIYRDLRAGIYLAVMLLLYFGMDFLMSTNRGDLSKLASDSSSLYRIEIWKASWELFQRNIVFGAGPGSVAKLLSYSSDTLKGYIFHAHNIPLHILAETGLMGFSAFTVMIFTWLKRFAVVWKHCKYSEHSYVAVGFAAALVSMLVHGLVDCAVFIPSRSMIFVLYIALFPALYMKSFTVKEQQSLKA